MRQDWRPERAISIADYLSIVLDQLEVAYENIGVEPTLVEPVPHPSGLSGLDRVCDGGLWPGTVTILEGPLAAQTQALLYAVARNCATYTLFVATCNRAATLRLLSGAAGLPEAILERVGLLDDNDWKSIAEGIGPLADRHLLLSKATSFSALHHLLDQHSPDVLIIEDPDQIADPATTGAMLSHLALTTGVAVLTAMPEVPDQLLDVVTRVAVSPSLMGSRATLITVGGPNGLTAADVSTSLLLADAET